MGRYRIKLLQEKGPNKVVSIDLTGAVDIFREIITERFPKYRRRILIVQANIFRMPFRDEVFDFVFSLGVLMHTGNTREAIKQAARVLKDRGQINLWVYGAIPVHIDNVEPNRGRLMTLGRFLPYWLLYAWVMIQDTSIPSAAASFRSGHTQAVLIQNLVRTLPTTDRRLCLSNYFRDCNAP